MKKLKPQAGGAWLSAMEPPAEELGRAQWAKSSAVVSHCVADEK